MLPSNIFLESLVELQGLVGTVEVWREPSGVIHVKAENQLDLFFAQGFVHASERLWQMDYQRRNVAGRLAEILGPPALEEDIFQRTLGLYPAAENAYTNLSIESKNIVDAYTAGVNAYLELNPSLPLEFQTLNYTPEPWQPADSLAVIKLLSLSLGNNFRFELSRARLLAQGFTLQQIEAYFSDSNPPLTVLSPTDVSQIPGLTPPATPLNSAPSIAPQPLTANLNSNLDLTPSQPQASNNWVVSGDLTATGKPFLANDPHLGLGIPNIWHLIDLEAPNFKSIGASIPGSPLVVIGRNAQIAWGVTNSGADVQDLYSMVEVVPGQSYSYQGQTIPYEIRQETIAVRGGPDQTINVRESVYGPVISDALNLPEPLALKWVSLDPIDSTFTSIFDLNQANNWQEFVSALNGYVGPSQNYVYADRAGNIGYYLSGQIPIRAAGHSGEFPIPGTGNFDWQGFIPFEQMPQIYNPAKGYIVTANNPIAPQEYPYFISSEWASDYRAQRINELLANQQPLTIADMQRIQLDWVTLLYRDFRDTLVAIRPVLQNTNPVPIEALQWLDLVLQWDGNATLNSQQATVFESWYSQLAQLAATVYGLTPRASFVLDSLSGPDPIYGNSVAASLATAAQVFQQVVDGFAGVIPTWGEIHQVTFNHPVLPVNRQLPFGGDLYTVNVGPYDRDTFLMSAGPSYRQIIDLAVPDNSLFIHPMGQNQRESSLYFDNLLLPWQQGNYVGMRDRNYPIAESVNLSPIQQDLVFGNPNADSITVGVGVSADGVQDLFFTGSGADLVDVSGVTSPLAGNNKIFTSTGDDEIFVSKKDRVFGGAGNDTFYANSGSGENRLYGNEGNDTFFLGGGDRIVGGEGDDVIYVNPNGTNNADTGGNTISGSAGGDLFWIAVGSIPNITDLNLITDFEVNVDSIGFGGIVGINPTAIAATQSATNPNNTIISVLNTPVAELANIDSTSLTANSFLIQEPSPIPPII